MGLLKWIRESILEYGESISEAEDEEIDRKGKYHPRFNGQWVNKGTRKQENWVWVDKVTRIRPVYVNVFQIGDDYIITMGNSARPDAIDSTECENEWQAEHLMKNLGLYYEYLGNVTINSELGE